MFKYVRNLQISHNRSPVRKLHWWRAPDKGLFYAHLGLVTLIVHDYDEALASYVGKLGFILVGNPQPEQDKRWVTIRPPNAPENVTTILLARAAIPEQAKFIGDQAGGRVFLFLATDDFDRDYAAFAEAAVEWVRPPAVQPYGKVAVFADLYGNRWDLVQFAPGRSDPPWRILTVPPPPVSGVTAAAAARKRCGSIGGE